MLLCVIALVSLLLCEARPPVTVFLTPQAWENTVFAEDKPATEELLARAPAAAIVEELKEGQMSPEIEYFDDFLPWFYNSTKFKENLLYEKKKYLSTVLGQHRKFRAL